MMTTNYRSPDEAFNQGKRAFEQGDHDEATRAYVWYWNNALDYDPALSGVRTSYLLTSFREVAEVHPPAEQAYQDLIDRNRRRLETSPSPKALSDYRVLLRQIGRGDDFIAMVAHLAEQGWDHHSIRSQAILRLLNEAQQWELVCALYPTPEPWLEREISRVNEHREQSRTSELPSDIPREMVARFIREDEERLCERLALLYPAFLEQDHCDWEGIAARLSAQPWLSPASDMLFELARERGREDIVTLLDDENE